MNPILVIVLNPTVVMIIVAAAMAIFITLYLFRSARTQKPQSESGPEYDHAIDAHGDRPHAQSAFEKGGKRLASFDIPLNSEESAHYAEEWRLEQSLFEYDPKAAVRRADRLAQDVLRRRGYALSDFDQNAPGRSLDQPRVVENYRVAHEIALQGGRGRSTMGDLRKAMASYQALLNDLLDHPVGALEEVRK